MIREATQADVPAIMDIWNQVIRDSIATFNTIPKGPHQVAQLLGRQPFLVAQSGRRVGAFATYSQFRKGPGYVHTAEHSVHVAAFARGLSLGRALLSALEDHAREAGIHVMVAGVSGENVAGQRFHAAMGYEEVGRMREVGQKFGRWHDLVLMQKTL